jgi:hypothetical protein
LYFRSYRDKKVVDVFVRFRAPATIFWRIGFCLDYKLV